MMLKSLILGLILIGLVFGDDPVRVKLTKHKKAKSSSSFGNPTNETLVDHEYYYVGEIHVGTPPKKFLVNFDTGSPDFWLASKNCTYIEGGDCKSQVNRYDLSASSTGKNLYQDLLESYGSGYAIGGWATDKVGLTPDASGATTKETFNFGFAHRLLGFNGKDYDGLFGLSFQWPGQPHPPFIEYLRDNKVFEQPIFTVWLERNVTDHVGGEIIFGGKDKDRCGEDIVTVPCGLKKPWWTFKTDETNLDGEKIAGSEFAVTDTGTTLMYVPTYIYNAISRKYPLPSQGNPNYFNCGEHEDIKLELVIGGKKLQFDAKSLIYADDEKPGKCMLGIIDGGPKQEGYLLGDPFIKSYCQIHNYKDETLTLALAKQAN